MNKKDGKQIADAVRARLANTAHPQSAPPPYQPMPVPQPVAPSAHAPDVYEQLRKLGELRDLGVVTPDEFEHKKRELLARI